MWFSGDNVLFASSLFVTKNVFQIIVAFICLEQLKSLDSLSIYVVLRLDIILISDLLITIMYQTFKFTNKEWASEFKEYSL